MRTGEILFTPGNGNGNMINNLRYGSLFGYNSNDIG